MQDEKEEGRSIRCGMKRCLRVSLFALHVTFIR